MGSWVMHMMKCEHRALKLKGNGWDSSTSERDATFRHAPELGTAASSGTSTLALISPTALKELVTAQYSSRLSQ